MGHEELLVAAKGLYEKSESLQFQLDQLKKMIFGSKSERFVPEVALEQTSLDFGDTPKVKKEEPATETITYERKKNNGKKPSRQPLPAHLERVVQVIEPEEDVTGLISIGKEVTEELEYTPAKLFVRQFVRVKYVKQQGEKTKVLIGKLPERPLPKCIAGPMLLAAIIVAKFVDHRVLWKNSIKDKVLFKAVLKMREGLSRSICRNRPQTALCCEGKEPLW